MESSLKTIVPFALAALLIFTSCSNNNDAKKSKTALLVQHTWKFLDLTSLSTDPDVLSELADYKAILANHELTFKENKTYTYLFPNNPDLAGEGTWKFASNETKLIVEEDGNESTFDIIKLDESTLELKYLDEFSVVDINYIYKKK